LLTGKGNRSGRLLTFALATVRQNGLDIEVKVVA